MSASSQSAPDSAGEGTSAGPVLTVAMKARKQKEAQITMKECRVMLIGKTGNGKSSTGNTFLSVMGVDRSHYYETGQSMQSITKKCQWRGGVCFGVQMEIADTPGFFDTDDDEVTVAKEITKVIGIMSPGPHALLLVVRCDVKFTKEEADCVKLMKEHFGDNIMRHVIIVFTHCDRLPKDEQTSACILAKCPKLLTEIVQEAGNRYVLFNNAEKQQSKTDDQVHNLLLMIQDMLSDTDNQCFSNPVLAQCEEAVLNEASHLADFLDPSMTAHHRNLIKAALESRESVTELLHEILDKQRGAGKLDGDVEKHWVSHILSLSTKLLNNLEQTLTKEQDERRKIEEEKAKLAEENVQLLRDRAERLYSDNIRLDREKKQLEDEKGRLEAQTTQLKIDNKELKARRCAIM